MHLIGDTSRLGYERRGIPPERAALTVICSQKAETMCKQKGVRTFSLQQHRFKFIRFPLTPLKAPF